MISEAQKYGAKVALYGRKINNSEHQLAFIEMLRRIVDRQITPEEAVGAYHGVLAGLNITPYRSLEEDMQLTTAVMSYAARSEIRVPARVAAAGGTAGSGRRSSPTAPAASPPARAAAPVNGSPDFSKMSPEERLAYHRARIART